MARAGAKSSGSLAPGIYIEGFRGKSLEEQLQEFEEQLRQYAEDLEQSAPMLQNAMARLSADIYKSFLRAGVGDELSKLTNAARGGVIPPLATLADHVTIKRTAAYGTPALVQFEDEHWTKIALLLDRGYAIILTSEQRKAVFARASKNGYSSEDFLENDMGASGIWLVPARPHAWFLSSSEIEDKIREVIDDWQKSQEQGNLLKLRLPTQKVSKQTWVPPRRRVRTMEGMQLDSKLANPYDGIDIDSPDDFGGDVD